MLPDLGNLGEFKIEIRIRQMYITTWSNFLKKWGLETIKNSIRNKKEGRVSGR